MRERRKPKILDNLGLRIGALVAAVIIWLIITNVNDPITYLQFYNVPVKLTNTNLITDAGDVYMILDDSDVIPVVTVTAPRSIIDSLGEENIIATADVKNLSSLNTISISLSTNKYYNKIESISGSIDTVRLSVEKKASAHFTLKVNVTGTPASGYVQSDVTAEQNQIRLSGPESVVKAISTAEATVDVTGASGTVTTSVDVKLFDADGNPIDSSSLTMNISTVKVTVAVLPTKEVPIVGTAQGTPAAGYALTGTVTSDPEKVTLKGRASVLDVVESIVVPSDVLDVAGASDDIVKVIDISKYLPENTALADSGFDGTVTMTVGIDPVSDKEVVMAPADITLSSIPTGCTAQVTGLSGGTADAGNGGVDVTLQGLAAAIKDLSIADLVPYVDVSSLLPASSEDYSGTYTGTVSYAVPDGVTVPDAVYATIRVTSENSSAGRSTADGTASETDASAEP
jgi:YbbR domain-containing protein